MFLQHPLWSRLPAGAVMLALLVAADARAAQTTRVSVDSNGAQTDDGSFAPSISANGHFVTFTSAATNLVPEDTNENVDVFVHDRKTGTISRVSVDSDARQGTGGDGSNPVLSKSGRLVAFESSATNLVADDTNDVSDIFVHDREKGTTVRVSVDSASAEADGSSIEASISSDGRFVAFVSDATGLVPEDTNGARDVFVHDRSTAQTTRVSVDSNGAQTTGDQTRGASLSASGRFVAFQSNAPGLVLGDTNDLPDIFVHDRKTGQTTRVSVDSAGTQADGGSTREPSISANGRFVAFASDATNLVLDDTNGVRDAFVHDRKTGQTTRVSLDSDGAQGIGEDSEDPSISSNGRYVAFESQAANLVAGDANGGKDVFLRDRKQGKTTRLSVDSAGQEVMPSDNANPSISGKGRFVAFFSGSTGLVPDDTNGTSDVFLHDRK